MLLDNLSKNEFKRVAGEYIKARMGVTETIRHQATLELLQRSDQAHVFAELQTRGLSTSDVTELTAAAVEVLAQQAPFAPHRALLKFVQAKSYRPQQIAISNIQPQIEAIEEGGDFPESRYTQDSITNGQVKKHGASLLISKELLRNDPEQLASLPSQFLASAYTTEAAQIFSALEANANLADGSPLLDTSHTGTGAWLEQALDIWRSAITDAEPAHVIIPPSKETAFREFAVKTGLKLNFHIRTDVTKAYLLADPRVKPSLVLLALSEKPTIDTETHLPIELNAGMAIRIEHSFKIVPVARNAISMTFAA